MRKLSGRWWLEKALFPALFVAIAAVASWYLGPEILHRRDELRSVETMRLSLVDEVGGETAALTTVMWKYERALDAQFENLHRVQSARFRERLRSTCGHATTVDDDPPALNSIDDPWIRTASVAYFDRFDQHQEWAVRQKIRFAFLFAEDKEIQSTFARLEDSIGMSADRLRTRRLEYERLLALRETAFAHLVADYRSRRVSDKQAHASTHLRTDRADFEKLTKSQPATLLWRSELSQQQLFQLFLATPIRKTLAMSLVRRSGT